MVGTLAIDRHYPKPDFTKVRGMYTEHKRCSFYQIGDVLQCNNFALQKIIESSWSGNNDLNAAHHCLHLLPPVSSSVHANTARKKKQKKHDEIDNKK